MNPPNQKADVAYADIKRYVDTDFGPDCDLDDDVNLIPPGFTPDDIHRLLDTIAEAENCPAVRQLTFGGDDRVFDFCKTVAGCINNHRFNHQAEGPIQ